MKRKLLDLQDRIQIKKRRVLKSVAEAVELTQKSLQSADASVDTVPLSEVPVTTGGDNSELAAELDKVKVHIEGLESAETITVRWHVDFLDKVNNFVLRR